MCNRYFPRYEVCAAPFKPQRIWRLAVLAFGNQHNIQCLVTIKTTNVFCVLHQNFVLTHWFNNDVLRNCTIDIVVWVIYVYLISFCQSVYFQSDLADKYMPNQMVSIGIRPIKSMPIDVCSNTIPTYICLIRPCRYNYVCLMKKTMSTNVRLMKPDVDIRIMRHTL